jgi:hypothetical protein
MSTRNGALAEGERKKFLEAQGHVILNLGQNQYGDLEDICCNTIIEVKTSKHPRKKLKNKEKIQLQNLLDLRKWRKIRYDIRYTGGRFKKPQWVEFSPDRVVPSFLMPLNNTKKDKPKPQINSKRVKNKNKGLERGKK